VEVIQLAPRRCRKWFAVYRHCAVLRHISAVTIAVELGNITSRFESAP